jgi:integrase
LARIGREGLMGMVGVDKIGEIRKIGNHTFRATGITAYLKNGGTLEKAAAMANHASTRTTQLYDC